MTSIIQTQGIHHITLNGTDRITSINFWQEILGMPLIFEQPNLDDLSINHLYFDCGDGRTVTVFTREGLQPKKTLQKTYVKKNYTTQKITKLIQIKGLGPKSIAALSTVGVFTILQLKEKVKADRFFLKDILPFGAHHKKIAANVAAL